MASGSEEDFCFLNKHMDPVFEACNSIVECSEACRNAVEQYKEKAGCCAYDDYINNSELFFVFSECEVDAPAQCTSSSPPREFLKCANSDAAI